MAFFSHALLHDTTTRAAKPPLLSRFFAAMMEVARLAAALFEKARAMARFAQ